MVQRSMAVNLYRRHRRDCKAGHAEQLQSSEFDERKKGWKRCECPIVVSGTLQKRFRRQSTGVWEWDDARAIAAQFGQAGNWDGTTPVPPAPSSATSMAAPPQRTTIAEATEAFLVKCQSRNIADPTLRKYKTFIKQFNAYCEGRGYAHLDQLTITDMDKFYSSWADGIRARAKKLDRLKSFVKFCLTREWLTKDITKDIQPPQGSSIAANKTPFTDDEMNRIYAACDKFGPPIPAGRGYRPWGGEDAKDFIMLSVYTGLRISDVSLFDITKRLTGNNVFLRMHKTKKELYTWVPDWLVARLNARVANRGNLIFRDGHSMVMRTVTETWRRKLKKIFKLAGPWDETPTPHKFRHTFVRILLEKGVPDTDVAELIGDSVEILRKHYSRWLPSRQARLSNILKEAFADKPSPKVVAIR